MDGDDRDRAAAIDTEHDEEVRWLLHRARTGSRIDSSDRSALASIVIRDRRALGLTQVRLADLSGVPLRTIKHMEAGGTPHIGTLLLLLDGIAAAAREAMPSPPVELDPSDPVYLLANALGPMYAALPPHRQAEALRRMVLLLEEISKENP
ncbi:helix-turn-helix domain-containing protein [Nocardia sp. NPDC088792]|uniref:helix-turn-helix domain-containing protein n=1 Tax=Nocardia sp. NPDC088792 TaxID=3364332 RepID=UPI0037FE7549